MAKSVTSLNQLSQRYANGRLTRTEYLRQRELLLDRLQAHADTAPSARQAVSIAAAVKTQSADTIDADSTPDTEKVTRSQTRNSRSSGPVSMKHYVIPAVALTLLILISLFLLSMLW